MNKEWEDGAESVMQQTVIQNGVYEKVDFYRNFNCYCCFDYNSFKVFQLKGDGCRSKYST